MQQQHTLELVKGYNSGMGHRSWLLISKLSHLLMQYIFAKELVKFLKD